MKNLIGAVLFLALAIAVVFVAPAHAAEKEWVGSHFFSQEGHWWWLVDKAVIWIFSFVLGWVALWLYQTKWSQARVSRNRDEADRFVTKADKVSAGNLGLAHAIITAAVLAVDVARFGVLILCSTILAIVL